MSGHADFVAENWSTYVAALREAEGDERVAVANSMRLAHGMAVVGHGLTFDFFRARRAIEALKGFHKNDRDPGLNPAKVEEARVARQEHDNQ